MDLYTIFKFLHVMAAIAWIGGGMIMLALAILAERRKDDAAQLVVVDQLVLLSMRWFTPASISTLVFGIVAASIYNFWSEAWVILGLLGFAATFVTGFFLIKPLSEQVAKLKNEGNLTEAKAIGQKMMMISKFDYVVLTVVVADMVMKPSWGDWLTLLVFAIVLIGAAALFLNLVERVQKMMPPKAAA